MSLHIETPESARVIPKTLKKVPPVNRAIKKSSSSKNSSSKNSSSKSSSPLMNECNPKHKNEIPYWLAHKDSLKIGNVTMCVCLFIILGCVDI